MMRSGKILLLIFVSLALNSCFKKDKMIPMHPRGNIDTIEMTPTYINQVYYNLDSGRVVSSDLKTSIDLGFECSSTGWHILLNTSDFMKVADMGAVTLGAAPGTNLLVWKFDKSDGNPDSTGIGVWFSVKGTDTVSNNHVYAIDRGMDELGNNLGKFQVQFDSLKNNRYYFRYAPFKGGTVMTGVVSKDQLVSYTWFSLKSGLAVNTEPPKNEFDLLFTQYTTMLYDEGVPYPYLVTGVLSNRNKVEVAMDSTHGFFEITREIALAQSYSRALDAIGYDWKILESKATGSYVIRKNRSYMIHTVSGAYLKIRFIGFYNKKFQKGYPVFEFQRL